MRRILSFCLFLLLTVVCLQAEEESLKDVYLTNKSSNERLSKWLHFYELSIDDFQFILTSKFSLEEDTSSIYNRSFDEEELFYDSLLNDYSPNKSNYVSLLPAKGVYFNKEKKEYCYAGGDDCEEIYYVDLDKKNTKMIQWNGVSQNTKDVFWVNSDTFALLTLDSNNGTIYRVGVYTILKDKNEIRYQIYETQNKIANPKDYFQDVVLKERNIKKEKYD